MTFGEVFSLNVDSGVLYVVLGVGFAALGWGLRQVLARIDAQGERISELGGRLDTHMQLEEADHGHREARQAVVDARLDRIENATARTDTRLAVVEAVLKIHNEEREATGE